MTLVWHREWDANQGRKQIANGAFQRITRMITAALSSCLAVRRGNYAYGIYVDHFHDDTLIQLATVRNTLKKMERRIVSGNELIQMRLKLTPPRDMALPQGVVWGLVEAYAYPGNPPPSKPVQVFVCPSFFTGDLYLPRRGDANTRTATGTVIHELSHALANTRDHAYTHQPAYANLTAAQAATNADSYREFCQSFDLI